MMGLLDPRLMAFLQQRGVQMPPRNMGAPQMPRVNRPMPQPKGMVTNPGFPSSGTFFPARPNMQVNLRAMPPVGYGPR